VKFFPLETDSSTRSASMLKMTKQSVDDEAISKVRRPEESPSAYQMVDFVARLPEGRAITPNDLG